MGPILTIVAAFLTCTLFGAALRAETPAASLRAQIEALTLENGIRLEGARRIQESPPRLVAGDVEAQIRALLEDHNYVVMRNGAGAIDAIIVSGQKADKPAFPQQVSVHTTRQGSNHFVEAVILGERPARLRVKLMLDTGASQVVLPKSMLDELGFAKGGSGGVRDAVLQTANGSVNGYVATLRAVEVGQALETDVQVAFIDDELLGGNKLLGMSFLGRFVVTLDDAAGTLRLSPRSR